MHPSMTSAPATRVAGLLAVLLIALGGCSGQQVVEGECRSLYGADICAWNRVAGDDLIAFGITVPMQVVDSAPSDAPMVWPPAVGATIPLPDAARAAGFDNVTIYWESHGHPPAPYLVPHFDFHFNTVTTADIGAFDCADTTKPARLPEAYALPDIEVPGLGMLVGLCVPQMGMHALPSAELESGRPFAHTMIVGYYGGQPIFVEPMIARAALLGRRSFAVPVPRVPDASGNVRYPEAFRAEYDSTAQVYRLVFSGLDVGGTTP